MPSRVLGTLVPKLIDNLLTIYVYTAVYKKGEQIQLSAQADSRPSSRTRRVWHICSLAVELVVVWKYASISLR
jgi:hypothetical protein